MLAGWGGPYLHLGLQGKAIGATYPDKQREG